MYSYQEITCVDIELSSECNAACPQCPRNFHGYPNNRGYVEHSMTLTEAKQIFQPDFLSRLHRVYFNGNYGDLVMNPQTIDIIKYFRSHTPPHCEYRASTNAGARDKNFWIEMANLGVTIYFCLDGTDNETHAFYRRNTLYDTVLKNAKTFISAGGRAIWKMIEFDHNRHQIDQAKQLSEDLGFFSFFSENHRRNNGPVYDKQFNLVGKLGSFADWDRDAAFAWVNSKNRSIDIRDMKNSGYRADIRCRVKQDRDVYVSSTGRVFPCCYMGYEPETYERGSLTRTAYQNHQLIEIMDPNNALEHGLENCIQWFNRVEQSWSKESFEDGRLIVCNDSCGRGNPYHDHSD